MITLKDNFKIYFLDYLKFIMKQDWLTHTNPFRPNYIKEKLELEKEDPFELNDGSNYNNLSFFFSFLAVVVNLCIYFIIFSLLKLFKLDWFLIGWIIGCATISTIRFYRYHKKKELGAKTQ